MIPLLSKSDDFIMLRDRAINVIRKETRRLLGLKKGERAADRKRTRRQRVGKVKSKKLKVKSVMLQSELDIPTLWPREAIDSEQKGFFKA